MSLGVTCAGVHACGELMTPLSKFTSVLCSFLISSSAVHHSCSVVGELITIKLFHQVLGGKDRQFCCVSFCLVWMSAVCRHPKPAYRGTLLVLGEALESFGGWCSVAAHAVQGLAVCCKVLWCWPCLCTAKFPGQGAGHSGMKNLTNIFDDFNFNNSVGLQFCEQLGWGSWLLDPEKRNPNGCIFFALPSSVVCGHWAPSHPSANCCLCRKQHIPSPFSCPYLCYRGRAAEMRGSRRVVNHCCSAHPLSGSHNLFCSLLDMCNLHCLYQKLDKCLQSPLQR